MSRIEVDGELKSVTRDELVECDKLAAAKGITREEAYKRRHAPKPKKKAARKRRK